ncbi:bifunctional riboflavin kinase/FAD synthetase [Aureimonas sp. OT7]|uniref:bifunctional riboflavin kinase/FAD synthetase n=1 Tax=Aureimonas sp. OT7 TaxID=2816454 RepID=UPI00177E0139|nr:bifunctional riboflavin kinase/FAD synthetase [Aureimonas sp. OT7]QOG07889.1 bifunctional riboflavin kinase/FAD synthetase [Aureimonas sp. OT7]
MTAPGRILRLDAATALPEDLRGGVVAIGNFDGVHRGHQAVLSAAAEIATRERLPLVCLTFEPHPRSVFRPEQPVARLTPAPLKARILDELGFDAVVEQAFTREFASETAESFIEDCLLGALGARHVVVGYDFHFGARRAGTAETLAAACGQRTIGVSVIAEFDDEGGAVVSSSRIRSDLSVGDVAGANALLGYRWIVEGEIVHGRKLGRTLGYPTANMTLPHDTLLMQGIYAVKLTRADGVAMPGVASFGRRPTFDGGAALFETFVFDFDDQLYGETVAVSVFGRLRGEMRFDDAKALVAQMDRDSQEARALLAGSNPLSPLDARLSFGVAT